MAEKKKTTKLKQVRLFALNITTDPHSPDGYVALLRRAVQYKNGALGRSGHRFAQVAYMQDQPDDAGLYEGRLATFAEVDLAKPVLNTNTSEQAKPDEVRAISMPAHLKPMYRRIDFFLQPEHHLLFFHVRDTTPETVARYFREILNHGAVRPGERPVHVTIEQSHNTLEVIFGTDRQLTTLKIFIARPNPDDFGDDEYDAKVQERMARQNAHKFALELTGSKATGGLQPDESTKALAESALINGKVVARGYDVTSGHRFKDSTIDHPRIEEGEYDPAKGESEKTGIIAVIRKWVSSRKRTSIRVPPSPQ